MILKNLKYHKKIHIGYIIMVLIMNTAYLFLEVEKNKYGTLFYENREYYFNKMQEISNILYTMDNFLLFISVMYLLLCKYLYKGTSYGTTSYLIVSCALLFLAKMASEISYFATGNLFLLQPRVMVTWLVAIIAVVKLMKKIYTMFLRMTRGR